MLYQDDNKLLSLHRLHTISLDNLQTCAMIIINIFVICVIFHFHNIQISVIHPPIPVTVGRNWVLCMETASSLETILF